MSSTTNISKSLLTNVLSVYFVLTLIVTCVQVMGEYFDTKSQLVQELQNQQSTFSNSLARSLWEYNNRQIEAIAEGLINIPAIAGIVIRDEAGDTIVKLGLTESINALNLTSDVEDFVIQERNGLFGYYSSIIFEFAGDSNRVGDVTLFSTRDIALDRIKFSLYFIFGNAIIKSTFLIVLFTLAFSRMLNRPMNILTQQIRNFRLDDLEHSRINLKNNRHTEFNMVEQAYNQLLDNLEDYQEDLKRTQQQLLHANQQLDEQNAVLEQEVARKTSSLSQVLTDLERRKDELERRQGKLEREIRQRKIIEDDLRETNSQLQSSVTAFERVQDQLIEAEKLASLGRLVAGITHDVNTPLGIGITATSLLRDKLDNMQQALENKQLTEAQMRELLDASLQSVELLESNLGRASDLLDGFKQVAVDQTSDAVREINLQHYIQNVLQALQPRFKNTNHKISLDCPDTIIARCNAGALAQIITNLVLNSLIHAFEDDQHGRLELTVRRQGGVLHIDYKDDGKGLTEAQQETLFDPFFTTRRERGGSGLGTHIVHNLVEQTFNGTITVQSAPGEGLSYHIELPMQFIDSESN
ncbi:sensor histidine kinase [Pseudidiomarina terrestris]|uniref:histidine kinase n=1 Tax=Pseudidiomarina terrestris TaxID=2820060 RepID=A0AAW7R1J5_9GAMM|nr:MULTISPECIES: ATP-binding protein [unclassified Pseudidiomarina]MDN7125139.1 sensor histidine kinase [Pseudidiomarina sp. 1APP75-32.1]MDN7129900.1 sensor histidine kinase [Pseudidiomarina sp. 1APR75-15]MDN7136066.1 sensor histidine kinase [Pseudidiomarina sp. 1ASP75-5]MDN7138409.1 sensor histidine kinase [Pseudidiomarina sp. 1ASP75-14]MEA3588995.1 sensor histidine kinase [Pseudidiomarina sp. 1APP75-27a]